jgi:hypothetical protein
MEVCVINKKIILKPISYSKLQSKLTINTIIATNKIYACKVSRHDHLINKETGNFDPNEYEEHPERYMSTFAREVNLYKF